MAEFTYTVKVPGSVNVTELGTHFRIASAPDGFPATKGRADQALLRLPPAPDLHVKVRNRRPGDRMKPVGRLGEKRLKNMLIDRRIPREQRDRLPLLVVDDQIAWVPGVALDGRFAARRDEPAWLAELLPITDGSLPVD